MAHAVTLQLPVSLYDHFKSRAERTRRSLEAELLEAVATVATEEETLPEDMEQALAAILPDMTPLIERKTGPAWVYVAELQALGIAQDVVLRSNDWDFLSDVHAFDPSIALTVQMANRPLNATTLAMIQATGAWRSVAHFFKITRSTLPVALSGISSSISISSGAL